MRILLVEDNRPLSEWLARTLRDDNYAVDCVYDGVHADQLLRAESYALVILDLSLPKMDGQNVLRNLRTRDDDTSVLILTANNTVQGRVGGLDAGADDYLAKPFDVSELHARVRVLLRRGSHHKNPLFHCGSLTYDSNAKQFTLAGVAMSLTRREHTALETLIMQVGKTVAKKELIEHLSAMDEDLTPDAIEVYIHRLRRKLDGSDVGIVTLRGLGYLLQRCHGT